MRVKTVPNFKNQFGVWCIYQETKCGSGWDSKWTFKAEIKKLYFNSVTKFKNLIFINYNWLYLPVRPHQVGQLLWSLTIPDENMNLKSNHLTKKKVTRLDGV